MEYSFIGIDEGKQQVLRGDTSGNIHWTACLENHPTARSLQCIDDERVLVGYDHGYFLFHADTGQVLHQCSRWKDVTSVQQTSSGRILVTGLGLGGTPGIWVLTLDEKDQVIESVRRRGSYVRLMSVAESPAGKHTWLLGMNQRIFETNSRLRKIRRYKAPGFKHAWMARRLEGGDTLVSAGYGAFMARFNDRGKLIRTFGTIGDVPDEVNPFFYASFDIAADGSLLVANWQGHGPDRGDFGRQLLRFSAEGEYLESWSFKGVSSFQGLLLL